MGSTGTESPKSATSPPHRLAAAGGVYAVVAAVQRSLSLLLLPLYTRALTPQEYGDLGVVVAISAAVGFCFSLGLDNAVFRQIFLLSGAARKTFLRTAALCLFASYPLVGLLVGVPAALIGSSVGDVGSDQVLLGVAGSGILVLATTVPFAQLRAEERLADYVRMNAVLAIGTSALTLWFVVGLDWGVSGWLMAILAANLIGLVYAQRVVSTGVRPPYDWGELRSALRIGLPLVPHLLAHWGLQLSSRLVLAAGLASAASVGIYTVASNFALPALVFAGGLNQALMPAYAQFNASGRSEEGSRELGRICALQIALAMLIGLAVASIGQCLIDLMLPGEYGPAASLVPWLGVAVIAGAVYYVPINAIGLIAGRTTWVWPITVTTVLLQAGLTWVLVPRHGIVAAAQANAAAYVFLLLGMSYYAHCVLPNAIAFPWKRILACAAVASTAACVSMIATGHTTVLELCVRVLILLMAVAAMAIVLLGPVRRLRLPLTRAV